MHVIGNSMVDIMLVTGNSVVDIMLVIGNSVVDIMLVLSRIFTCLRALIFGEDFSSDPVSRVFGLIVHKSSGGQVQVDTAILSQVWPLASLQLVTVMHGLPRAVLCCVHLACTWNWHVGTPSGPSGKRQPAPLRSHLSYTLDVEMDNRLLPNHCDQNKAGADKPKQQQQRQCGDCSM